jgi:hypothetical protein
LLIAALVALGSSVPLLIVALLVFGNEASAQLPTPTPSPTRTPSPLTGVNMRLKRPGESPVIPSLGRDVWRFNADLPLPLNFDPNLKPIDVTVVVPGGGPHVNPLHVQQLLPRGKRWTTLATDANNGECRVSLVPRYSKWVLLIRCRGSQILPPFPTSTEFVANVQIGDRSFTSGVKDFRHLRVTLRRFP